MVTGFIGRARDGSTTTLGRNGSDYAATTLAALLGATEVTIWTDVGGVMTADPELVEEAYPVPRLTWHEAQELAHFGLRMFHRRTVLPLEQSGGRLRIRSTVDARRGHGHRRAGESRPPPAHLRHQPREPGAPVGGVAPPAPETSLAVRGPLRAGGGADPGVDGDAVGSRPEPGGGGRRDGGGASARGARDGAGRASSPRGEVELPPARTPVSLVSLVAEAMGQWPNVAGRFFGALGNVGINVRAIAQGASSRSIGCVVDAAETAEAVRTVHAAFNLAQTEVNVLLLGRGTVGGRLLAQLEETRDALRTRQGVDARLFGVVDRHGAHVDPRGLVPSRAPAARERPGRVAAGC